MGGVVAVGVVFEEGEVSGLVLEEEDDRSSVVEVVVVVVFFLPTLSLLLVSFFVVLLECIDSVYSRGVCLLFQCSSKFGSSFFRDLDLGWWVVRKNMLFPIFERFYPILANKISQLW